MLRLLVIEDELFVAAHIDAILSDEGIDVIGPVGTLDEAKLLARDETFDGALLDVNVKGGRIDDIADILTHRNIPYLFVTCCLDADLLTNHQAATVVHKPFKDADLIRAVRQLRPEFRQEFAGIGECGLRS